MKSWAVKSWNVVAGHRWLSVAILLVLCLVAAARLTLTHRDDIGLIVILCAIALIADRFWPTLDYRLTAAPMAPLVAFVGCDGSGKSTLTTDLFKAVSDVQPTAVSYLGLGSGAIGERIKRLPIIGRHVERRLARKAAQTRTRGEKIPGLFTALVVYMFSLARLRRFNQMLKLRRAGVVILTDRYPQIEYPGFYDGPGLSAASPRSRLVFALARQERRLYEYMTSFRPDVVVRLDVDVDTALARKPDHRADLLRKKVEVTPLLRFAGAPIVDLDATLPYTVVYRQAAQILGSTIARRAVDRLSAIAA
ncbi:nucleoside/nucleotide kinase family protein [Sphingomonas abietis]|uniref:ATP-binding protein n=1 Tax=Sphingomonas abietis TaxID=3012344 RepID=A0ABY7NJ70_9SPHN|nr:hypothetical protein [Sphingomonas abietis]WBO21035.1 hypothetical protein PBT88_12555 [Sphingomonas abietis]